jgi:arabinofuranosyltransferase
LSARLLVFVIAFVACLHAASYFGCGPVDDDYIVYRYAQNLIEGNGLVFNVGERIEGFTAPLWTFLIAAGLGLGIDPVRVSTFLSVFGAGLATFAVAEAWRRRSKGQWRAAPAILLCASPVLAYHGVAGLGTTLLAGLLALWLLFYEDALRNSRPACAASVVLAFACLMRQECALFALPFLFVELRRVRSAWPVAPIVALVGWTAFRLIYFGSWLPVTYAVKKLPLADDLAYGGAYLMDATLQTGVLLFLIAGLVAWRRAEGGLLPALQVAMTGLLLHSAYVVYVGGDFMAHARFFVPTLPLLFYFGCLGARSLLAERRGLRTILLLVAIAGLQGPQFDRVEREGEAAFFEARWARLGRHFGTYAPPGTTVALSPIGCFGYYSGLEIVDILGLTNTSTLDVEPRLETSMKGHHRSNPEWVLAQRPDVMILANGVVVDNEIVISAWEVELSKMSLFREGYRLMATPIEGDENELYFYKRVDAPNLPGARPFDK